SLGCRRILWWVAPRIFIRHPVIVLWWTPVWVRCCPVSFGLAPRLIGLPGAPTSDPGGRWLRVVRSRLRCYRRCLLRGGVLCGLRCLGNRGLLWCFLPGLLGWLWLLPRRAASAFWGTTIRGTGDQIEFRLDAQHLVESCCEEVSTAAHLYGISCAVIIEANGQQFAVKAYDLGIAVDGHPDQARFVL